MSVVTVFFDFSKEKNKQNNVMMEFNEELIFLIFFSYVETSEPSQTGQFGENSGPIFVNLQILTGKYWSMQ